MRFVFDLEGNGLREEISKVWCIVIKDIDTNTIHTYGPEEYGIKSGIEDLGRADLLIGHNIISYDLSVLLSLYNFEFKGEVYDTLVTSRLLYPDRTGGHSLAAWGSMLGRKKPEHDEWDHFSEEMMHRCKEDVEINHLVYLELERERGR